MKNYTSTHKICNCGCGIEAPDLSTMNKCTFGARIKAGFLRKQYSADTWRMQERYPDRKQHVPRPRSGRERSAKSKSVWLGHRQKRVERGELGTHSRRLAPGWHSAPQYPSGAIRALQAVRRSKKQEVQSWTAKSRCCTCPQCMEQMQGYVGSCSKEARGGISFRWEATAFTVSITQCWGKRQNMAALPQHGSHWPQALSCARHT